MNWQLGAKRLGLLRELTPRARRFAVLADPNHVAAETPIMDLEAAASGVGLQLEILSVGTSRDIDSAFAIFEQRRADALLVSPQALHLNRRTQILTLAARQAVPSIYPAREWAAAGGLMSYGSSLSGPVSPGWHLYRQRSQGQETGRPADPAGHQVRFRHQPPDRRGAPHRHSTDAARPRR